MSETDRAASETLGFVLVFALLLSTVVVVYAVGFQGLTDARDFERVNNAERAFEVFADNVEDISHRGAPSRATELKLADAKLYVGDPVYVNTTVRSGGTVLVSTNSSKIAPLIYEADGARVVYANGALFRASDGGVAMVRDPGFLLSEDRTLIEYVRTTPESTTSVAGSETVLVRTRKYGSAVPVSNASGRYEVTLNVTSPRASAWVTYLDEELGWAGGSPPCDRSGDRVTCEFETDRVTVSRTTVGVSIT